MGEYINHFKIFHGKFKGRTTAIDGDRQGVQYDERDRDMIQFEELDSIDSVSNFGEVGYIFTKIS